MWRLTFLAIGVLTAAPLPRNEAQEGWIQLQEGNSAAGWISPAGNGWSMTGGAFVMDGQTAGGGLTRTTAAFADFVLRFDVRAAASNSRASLFVRAAREGAPKDTGYEIQLGPGNPDLPPGSIAGHAKAPPSVNGIGQWVPYEVEAAAGNLTVRVAGYSASTAANLLGQAGLLMLQASRGGKIEIRNLRLKPLNAQSLFNGADLSGWKSTGTQPKQGGKKLLVFGGGKGKAKEAKWTVDRGMIHGEEGPGQLESAAPYGDFILQTAVRMNAKKTNTKRRYGLLIRGDAGQIGTGYEIGIQSGATGGISGLSPAMRELGAANQWIFLSVAAQNRHIQVWANGSQVADFDDVRPEGTNPKKAARTAPGVIAFYTPEDGADVDIYNVRVTQVPKLLGHSAPRPAPVVAGGAPAAPSAPSPAAPTVTVPPPPPVASGNNDQLQILQQQMKQQEAEKAQNEKKSQKISGILQQALKSPSPQEQVGLYDQILQLDPNNQVAFSARKEAQAKVDAQNAKAELEAQAEKKQETEIEQKKESFGSLMEKAEAAFLAGNLKQADAELSAAQKISPEDAQAKALRARLDAAQNRWKSVLGVAAVGAGAVLLGVIVWLFAAGRNKDPYLEIVAGLDKGKKFNIDQEVVNLGAIPEDGGAKNDIVLRDAERMVSRFHAQIYNRGGKLYVIDLGSSNGTLVNKTRVKPQKPCALKNGTHLNFGGTCVAKIGYENRSKKKKG